MQNKPNFWKSQMNVNKVLTRDYEKRHLVNTGKTNPIQTQYKANQSQNKPNSRNAKNERKRFFTKGL